MIRKTLFIFGLLFGLASVAAADNFRCPNGEIVSTGDNQSIVAMKCDPPTYKNARTESVAGYKGATILVSVEEWTYNEGPHRLVHILTFKNGLLNSVQTAGFGK